MYVYIKRLNLLMQILFYALFLEHYYLTKNECIALKVYARHCFSNIQSFFCPMNRQKKGGVSR